MTTILDKKSERLAIKPPGMFNVVLHNDDFTSMDFVIALLVQIFKKSTDEAMAITEHVHNNGKGIAGSTPVKLRRPAKPRQCKQPAITSIP